MIFLKCLNKAVYHHDELWPDSITASLRAELNHLHASSIEHLKQIHLKENSAIKRELESAMEHSHKQVAKAQVFVVPSFNSILLFTSLLFLAGTRTAGSSLRSASGGVFP